MAIMGNPKSLKRPYQTLVPRLLQNPPYVKRPCLFCAHDGLLCVFDEYDKHITPWNPATREFRLLPRCPKDIPPVKLYYECFIGFGFDTLSNDYKVIHSYCYLECDWPKPRHHSVYMMSTNSWRELKLGKDVIETLDSLYIDNNFGNACANGVYYWVATADHQIAKVLLAFNFSTEVFALINWPISQCLFGDLLRLPDGRISLSLSHRITSASNDVWLLSNDEGQYSWTKLLTIGILPGLIRMLGFWNNKEVFVESRSGQVLLYNLEVNNVGWNTEKVWYLLGAHT